ncbi:DUF4190 domain-containing protein [Protaetiibacter mangrovi]|uniref:DUF4190 domain-containing protein n=1 Tax=Protaetiibacter mangrovi TaxID=2970926 RepID=A0ABT1ZDA5_9MICO|nr:DUF4190 domain-containing protein [Protaetiibacter mangrovi]MCS0498690.1 DUF4190 domain-containing protein [Protaetiibacter mangrovi]TPW98290.1 DUF4190 domain-containing protein [Schumannella luteola]
MSEPTAPAPFEPAPNPYAAPANPYAAPANPYAVGAVPSSYQPVPTGPAPGLAPYSTSGAAYAYAPRTNGVAIASLVCSLAGLLVGALACIAGVILGHIALSQIRARGEGGRGMALGGLITGYVLGGLQLIFIALYIGFIVLAVSQSSYY